MTIAGERSRAAGEEDPLRSPLCATLAVRGALLVLLGRPSRYHPVYSDINNIYTTHSDAWIISTLCGVSFCPDRAG